MHICKGLATDGMRTLVSFLCSLTSFLGALHAFPGYQVTEFHMSAGKCPLKAICSKCVCSQYSARQAGVLWVADKHFTKQ